MSASYAFRPAEPSDRGYIIDTWLQTYRGSPFARKLPDFAYWSRFGHAGLVEHLVDQGTILVCCLPEGGPWMYGWSCSIGETLHYVFIKHEFRKQGLAAALLEFGDKPSLVTHMTTDFSQRLGRGRDVKFVNPYRGEKR